MDLYGGTASISQGNALSQLAQQINQANVDFNNTLAEQLDDANRYQDQDRTAKLQKNLLSGGTSGGKLAIIGKRGGIIRPTGVGGFKELPLSREEVLAKEAGAERVPLTNPPLAGEAVAQRAERTPEVYTAEGRLAEEEAARASDVAGSAGLKTTAKLAGEVAGKAATIGKIGVAGLGGGIDAFQDIGRLMQGQTGLNAFGSNSASRVGNIANIIGSGLEVAGVATGGITPFSLLLEGTGALIGLGGAIVEGVGEEESGDVAKEKEQKDISSQVRGEATTEQLTQAISRTQ
jgi:hypothetical protein